MGPLAAWVRGPQLDQQPPSALQSRFAANAKHILKRSKHLQNKLIVDHRSIRNAVRRVRNALQHTEHARQASCDGCPGDARAPAGSDKNDLPLDYLQQDFVDSLRQAERGEEARQRHNRVRD